MIKRFGNRETEELWRDGKSRRIPPDICRRAFAKLQFLDSAENVQLMNLAPGNRLKKLSGELANFWSLRINNQWRVMFRFVGTDAFDVQIIDYH
jgi:proteic killer suppression protein